MAEEEDEGPVSQTSYGLAQNPLMPMGDPLAYARVASAPEASVPRIQTQGMQPQAIMRPQPLNVPDMGGSRGGGAESPNQLQPSMQAYDPNQLTGGLSSLNQLLQLKGMESLIAPGSSTTTTTSASDVPMGGSASGPHSRNVSATSAGGYQDLVDAAAAKYGLDPKQLTHQLFRESGYNPEIKSKAGALGIGQFMPGTAPRYGMQVGNGVDERKDPAKSIEGAAHYMSDLKKMFNGNDQLALMGYNWGEGNVQKWLRNGADPSKVPDETQKYVRDITGRPIGPNQANVPAKGAAPMAAMVAAAGGGFKVPGAAPAFGAQPKAGDMSPHGGPYVSSGGKIYATDGDGRIVGQAVTEIAPDLKPSKAGSDSEPDKAPSQSLPLAPIGNDQGTPNLGGGITQPALKPEDIKPPASSGGPHGGGGKPDETPATAPTTTTTTTTTNPIAQTMGNDPRLQNLWKFMLIRSLFPQLQFRNIGYDPWAVHRFGQGGGY